MENNRLYSPVYLKDILEKFGFSFSKAFGQNFLIDGNIVRSIVDGAEVTKDDLVIEIGPGAGTLTEEIARRAGKVIAIEIDKRLLPLLDHNLKKFDNVEIINRDALEIDFKALIEEKSEGRDVKLISNLPYNVGTAIVTRILEEKIPFKSLTIMLQKEVAERMIAKEGFKTYGSLSVLVSYRANSKMVLKVPRTVFIPKPNVDSMVVRLDIKEKEEKDYEALMFKLVRLGFNQRRKTILNSFRPKEFGIEKEDFIKILNDLGLKENLRAEALSLKDYEKIAEKLKMLIKEEN